MNTDMPETIWVSGGVSKDDYTELNPMSADKRAFGHYEYPTEYTRTDTITPAPPIQDDVRELVEAVDVYFNDTVILNRAFSHKPKVLAALATIKSRMPHQCTIDGSNACVICGEAVPLLPDTGMEG